MDNKDKRACYICNEEIQDNDKSISVTYEHGNIKETYYLCSRECFSKLAYSLKDKEPNPLILINF